MSMIIKMFRSVFLFLLFFIYSHVNAEPEVLGWLETAYIQPWGMKVRAKLDTGALTSSIHATNIEPYQIDDELRVRFTITEPKNKTQAVEREIRVERPVIKETKIKEHVGESNSRYVVEIEICLNGKRYLTPVTLADRSGFHYPLLLGRRTLKENVIVDPAKTFTSSKSCLHAE